jgi:hypothetical protein
MSGLRRANNATFDIKSKSEDESFGGAGSNGSYGED